MKNDSDSFQCIEAYVKGLNLQVKENRQVLPLEMILLGMEFEEWTIHDTLAQVLLMAHQLSYDYPFELLRKIISD